MRRETFERGWHKTEMAKFLSSPQPQRVNPFVADSINEIDHRPLLSTQHALRIFIQQKNGPPTDWKSLQTLLELFCSQNPSNCVIADPAAFIYLWIMEMRYTASTNLSTSQLMIRWILYMKHNAFSFLYQ